jgi:hypothetical protein
MPLSGCAKKIEVVNSDQLYQAPAWPKAINLQKQSGVAKYITRGHAAYKGCVVNLETLKSLNAQNSGQ